MPDPIPANDIDTASRIVQFGDLLAAMDFPTPWTVEDPDDPGNIHAANGAYVCTCDAERGHPDEIVLALAKAIVLAVNTCAGFRAVTHG